FFILKDLMHRQDVDEIICATDAGREGELIFRLVYNHARCKKPFKRLWISSMEDKAIAEGLKNLKSGRDYNNLYYAAVCRARADWLVGMNATRLYTTQYHARLVIGRVQTPTLALLVDRHKKITNFTPEKYYNAHLYCTPELEGIIEKIKDEKEALKIRDICNGKKATVTSVEKKEKKLSPPQLFDLTTLQRECNRYFGYSAQKTLDLTQSLYEKKLVTYPRTESRFITDDMEGTANHLIGIVHDVFGFISPEKPDIKRIINNKKVSDHHALLPTEQIKNADFSKLSQDEINVLMIISNQLMCATGQTMRYETTEIHIDCEGYDFVAKGKVIIDPGWKKIETDYKSKFKKKQTNKKEKEDKILPKVKKNDTFEPVACDLTDHFTMPPKHYTEDTLLSAMETAGNTEFDKDTEKKGIGTPATRAGIIEKLINSKYVERKGKQLIATPYGINLIEIVPETLKSPKMTAEWENTLMKIQRGDIPPNNFTNNIIAMISKLVNESQSLPKEEAGRFGFVNEKEEIGKCPRCGNPVYESQKNFYCSNRECTFAIWKESSFTKNFKKKITKAMAKKLLAKGKVKVKGLYSKKKDKKFDATVVLDDTGKYVNFKFEF
ncbi:MAG: DNA topoisomerase III, partial [Eubacteriaceae bacterium]|nr:DNA topoisomerase III [Eubacteriaceae bacterium]